MSPQHIADMLSKYTLCMTAHFASGRHLMGVLDRQHCTPQVTNVVNASSTGTLKGMCKNIIIPYPEEVVLAHILPYSTKHLVARVAQNLHATRLATTGHSSWLVQVI